MRVLRDAREVQTLGGARKSLNLGGAREALSLGGALEALNWTVPAGTKVSWTGPAELRWPRTGFRLGIGDFPDIGLPSLANLGWRSLGAPLVDGMRSRAGTES